MGEALLSEIALAGEPGRVRCFHATLPGASGAETLGLFVTQFD
jgi:hypothetical protein